MSLFFLLTRVLARLALCTMYAGTAMADTGCAACEAGKTFSLKENEEECGECTAECGDGFVIATKCTTTADTTCKPAYTAFWASMAADCDVSSMSGCVIICTYATKICNKNMQQTHHIRTSIYMLTTVRGTLMTANHIPTFHKAVRYWR